MPFNIIINETSGTVLKNGAPDVERKIRKALNGQLENLHFSPAAKINDYILQYKKSDTPLLIGGGDGTISFAARQLFPDQKPFGIVPLGTMNLFACDLNIPADYVMALSRYRTHTLAYIDTGLVNGHVFLGNSILGAVPEAVQAREDARAKDSIMPWSGLIGSVIRGLNKQHRQKMILKWNHQRRYLKSSAIVVANNKYMQDPTCARERLKRESLIGGELSVYIAKPSSTFGSIRLLVRLVTGKWQKDPAINIFETPALDINLIPDKQVRLTIDGELQEMISPLHFEIRPRSLPVLLPAGPGSRI